MRSCSTVSKGRLVNSIRRFFLEYPQGMLSTSQSIAFVFVALGASACCHHRPPPPMVINVRCETGPDHDGPRMFHHRPGGPDGPRGMHRMHGMGGMEGPGGPGHDRGDGPPMGPPPGVTLDDVKNIERELAEARTEEKRACGHGLAAQHPSYPLAQHPCDVARQQVASLVAALIAAHQREQEGPHDPPRDPPKGRPHK